MLEVHPTLLLLWSLDVCVCVIQILNLSHRCSTSRTLESFKHASMKYTKYASTGFLDLKCHHSNLTCTATEVATFSAKVPLVQWKKVNITLRDSMTAHVQSLSSMWILSWHTASGHSHKQLYWYWSYTSTGFLKHDMPMRLRKQKEP